LRASIEGKQMYSESVRFPALGLSLWFLGLFYNLLENIESIITKNGEY